MTGRLTEREQIVLLIRTGRPMYCLCNPSGVCRRHQTDKTISLISLALAEARRLNA